MRHLRRIVGLAVLAGIVWFVWRFATTNAEPVVVTLPGLGALSEAPLWLTLVAAAGGGLGVGLLAALYQVAKLGLLARRYRKVAKGLEAEIHQLRNLPLARDEERPPRGSAGGAPDAGRPAERAGRGV